MFESTVIYTSEAGVRPLIMEPGSIFSPDRDLIEQGLWSEFTIIQGKNVRTIRFCMLNNGRLEFRF